ncbi:MAG: fimbria/pilus periplasmic chaperone [Candidatus Malihini olakiniferum]
MTPPMFRMALHRGQNLSLQFIEVALPQDKEAIFYINTLQIPPIYNSKEK